MKINNILAATARPEIYEPGTAIMWNDPWISTQLLPFHLDEKLDIASRLPGYIDRTVDWIIKTAPGSGEKPLNILDLGCGPGLYAERFAVKGHKVTGVDLSRNSIDYAAGSAEGKGLDISYICSNYLDLEIDPQSFDLIIMIYCDLGVLVPQDRTRLLATVRKGLKKGGLFIFDVLNDRNFETKISPDSWSCGEKGFWCETPHLVLSKNHVYEKEKVVLEQHVVADDSDEVNIYRFWTHFYNHGKLKDFLEASGFSARSFHEDILPPGNQWSGENVTFTVAEPL